MTRRSAAHRIDCYPAVAARGGPGDPAIIILFIANRELDGFPARVREIECLATDCDTCGYCAEVASRAVKLNPALPPELPKQFPAIRAALETYLGRLYDGSVFGQ